jgi:hypothetical protein
MTNYLYLTLCKDNYETINKSFFTTFSILTVSSPVGIVPVRVSSVAKDRLAAEKERLYHADDKPGQDVS